MPSNKVRMAGIAVAIIIIAVAYTGTTVVTMPDSYRSAVKVACGAVAIAGSLCLATIIRRSLLRTGGNAAFKWAYLAAMALSGLGLAEALSAFTAVNIGNALLAYCVIVAISGMLWVKFYGIAT